MNKTIRINWNNNDSIVNLTAVPLRGFRVGLLDLSGCRSEVFISKVSSILFSNSESSYDVLVVIRVSKLWVMHGNHGNAAGNVRLAIKIRRRAWLDFEKCKKWPQKFRKFSSMIHRKRKENKGPKRAIWHILNCERYNTSKCWRKTLMRSTG